jgi:hypothetical protein
MARKKAGLWPDIEQNIKIFSGAGQAGGISDRSPA